MSKFWLENTNFDPKHLTATADCSDLTWSESLVCDNCGTDIDDIYALGYHDAGEFGGSDDYCTSCIEEYNEEST